MLFLWCARSPVQAQVPDTLEGVLPEIEIEAARASETEATAPFAVSVLARPPEAVVLEPGLSLDNVLDVLPGVWINDRGHAALGERITIRGMGWRAAFGVRGVQVLLDGIPLTMPDGQAVVDIVDPAFVRRAEVIRGPASLFWGNAGGGALFLSTALPAGTAVTRVRGMGGSHGLRQILAEAAAPLGRHHVQAYASHIQQEGFRRYSEGQFTRAGLHGNLDLGPRTRLQVSGAAAVQDAQNPGSLTAAQVQENRQMAAAPNVETRAGKTSTQLQLGTTLFHESPLGLLSATAYGLVRDLDNPLSYAYVDVQRAAGGLRLVLQDETQRLRWGLGVDASRQQDDRFNWENLGGEPGGERLLDQEETVQNTAVFGYAAYPLLGGLTLSLGLRADRIGFSMEDRLLTNGDETGSRTFLAWSPSVGLSYRTGPALLFANYNTAFETPTTTELVNRPDGSGGFNPDLEPQRTRGFEVGTRGFWPEARLAFDAALFTMHVSNGIVPWTGDNDRVYYRNVGENTHSGVEVAADWQALRSLALQLSYTGIRHLREDGNWLPGVPPHRLYAALAFSRGGWWSRLATEAVGTYYVDDDNTSTNEGYAVVDFHLGHEGLSFGTLQFQPFFRIGNLFDSRYNGSVIVNAFGARYYEPAPGRTFQAGVNLSL